MKNAIRFLAVAYMLLFFVDAGMGGEKKAETDKGRFDSRLFDCAQFDTGKSCIRGEVTVVDAKAGRLTVATKDKQNSFGEVDSKAKPVLGTTKVGDVVEVAYTKTNGKLRVTSISPIQAPAEKK